MKKFILLIIAIICCYNYAAKAEFEYFGPPGGISCIGGYSGELYATKFTTISRSTNKGILWKSHRDDYMFQYDIESIYVSPDFILSSNFNGTDISTDHGETWKDCSYLAMTSFLKSGDSLFVTATGFNNAQNGIVVSTDGCESWVQIAIFPNDIALNKLCKFDGTMFVASTTGVLSSSNSGADWSQCSANISNIEMIDICSNNNYLFASSKYSGIYVSSDKGLTWKQSNIGLADTFKLKLCVNGDKIYAASPNDGLFVSSDNGSAWSRVNTGIPNSHLTCIFSEGDNIYVGTTSCVFKSDDKGVTWFQINDGITSGIQTPLLVEENNIYVNTEASIYQSKNNGKHWEEIYFSNSYEYKPFSTENRALYKSGKNIYVYIPNNLFFSTDEGSTWNKQANYGLAKDNSITCLTSINNKLIAGTKNNGIFVSDNNGTNWTPANSGYNDSSASMINIYKNTIYALGEKYIYSSKDSGATWQAQSAWPTNINTFHFATDKMFVGTNNGIYLSTNSGSNWNMIGYAQNQNSIFSKGDTTYYTYNGCLRVSCSDKYDWAQTSDYLSNFNNVCANSSYVFVGSRNGIGLTKPIFEFNAPKLTMPKNNADIVNSTGGFSWSTFLNVDEYRLQIALDSNFTNLKADTTLKTKFIYISNLLYATNYYWRVQSSMNGKKSDWSEIWHFRTSGFNAPTLMSPPNQVIDVMIDNTVLYWYGLWNSGEYRIQLALDSTFNQILLDSNKSANAYTTSILLKKLLNNTKYYWRVNFKYNGNTTPWSKTWFFTSNKLIAPQAYYPSNNSIDIPTGLNLAWKNLYSVDSSRVQLAKDSSFKDILFDSTLIDNSYVKISGLLSKTKYYYRAKAYNYGAESPWSDAWSFTTYDVNISLLYPNKSDTNVSTKVKMEWKYFEAVDNFNCQIALDSLFKNLVYDQPYTTKITYDIYLKNKTKYYWRVNVKYNGYTGPWSEIWSFTTEALRTPSLATPVNAANNLFPIVQLNWKSNSFSEKYHCQVATDINFANIVSDHTTLNKFTTPGNLFGNKKYYWRVQSSNRGQLSEWSEVWSFTTSAFIGPTLSAPANNSLNVPVNPKLSWNYDYEINSFHYQVALDSNFKNTIAEQSTPDRQINLTNLANHTKYYWRIYAKNSVENSPWSETWSFTTAGTGDVHDNSPGGEEISISPNPASDVMTINYKFEDADAVNLRIYNTLGEQILFMPNLNPAGTSRVDISAFYPGNYRLVFSAGGRNVVKTACVCR